MRGEVQDLLRATAVTASVSLVAKNFPTPDKKLPDVRPPQREEGSSAAGEVPAFLAGPRERAGCFSIGECISLLLAAAEDPAWRVRAATAREILSAFRFAPANYEDLHGALVKLLADSALQEVRLEALKTLACVTLELDVQVVRRLVVPLIPDLLRVHLPAAESAELGSGEAAMADECLAFYSPTYGATVSTPQMQLFEAAVEAALAAGKRAGGELGLSIVQEASAILSRGEVAAGFW